jgi:alkyldihydroxyacetonephosphate synthase
VRFKDFFSVARAVRMISQAGVYPSNCRILDPAEAYNNGAADGSTSMVLAFESAGHDVAPWIEETSASKPGPRLDPTRAAGYVRSWH